MSTLLIVILAAACILACQAERWPVLRFIKTLNFFDALPKLPFFQPVTIGTPVTSLKPGSLLFSVDKGVKLEFGPLDDIVMGGVSKTTLNPGDFDGLFTGLVSTSNNGGFSGIRTKLFSPAKDATSCTGFQLRVKGDGQRYKFIARDDTQWNGIAWSASFDTQKDKTVTVKLPIKELKPTRFAKTLVDHVPFDKTKFSGLQITLSKFEYDGGLNPRFTEGPFSLLLEELSMY